VSNKLHISLLNLVDIPVVFAHAHAYCLHCNVAGEIVKLRFFQVSLSEYRRRMSQKTGSESTLLSAGSPVASLPATTAPDQTGIS